MLDLASILADSFEADTLGQLTMQDGWAGSTQFTVDDSVVFDGTKAVSCTGSGNYDIYKACAATAEGEASIRMRLDGSFGLSGRHASFFINDGVGHVISEVGQKQNNIVCNSAGLWVVLQSNFNLNQWYKLTMQWSAAAGNKCRYKIDNSMWSEWLAPCQAWAGVPSANVALEAWSHYSPAVTYFDKIE